MGRLSATTARFIVPGSFAVEAEDLNAGCEGLTTRGRVAPFEAAAGAGALASAIITGGGNAVLASAEFDGIAGNDGADIPERSETEMFCGNASEALRWAISDASRL